MNCIYETQRPALVDRVPLTPEDTFKEFKQIVVSLDHVSHSFRPHHIKIPLSFMMLYATDCLSVGYFIRYVCSSRQNFDVLLLNLTKCILRSLELKALCQELCKPAQVHKLILNISFVPLKNEALESVKAILSSSQSAIIGLITTGDCIENIHLALKYIIEGISSNLHCVYLLISSSKHTIASCSSLSLTCLPLSTDYSRTIWKQRFICKSKSHDPFL